MLSLIPMILREVFTSTRFHREPEPYLVMDDPDQVEAFHQASRVDGPISGMYVFNTCQIVNTIKGAKKVLDLGCGPANQLLQVAQFCPETEFIGLDLSEEMLDIAKRQAKSQKVNNVSFVTQDITNLKSFADNSVDAVISTATLHHLPSRNDLEKCLAEASRVLKKEGALYIIDFGALKSLKSVIEMAYRDQETQPYLVHLDYERSLRAAFRLEDFESLAEKYFKFNYEVFAGFVPLLVIIKTPARELDTETKNKLKDLQKQIKGVAYKSFLDIRRLMRLSGLKSA